MIAGLLKEVVKICTLITKQNDYGEREVILEEVFTTRANVKLNGGERSIENNEIFYGYRYTFTIRGYHKVNEDNVVKWNDKAYRILSIDRTDKSKLILDTELIND